MIKQFGLIGEKLGHSLSPTIHNKIFEILNIQASYKLFPVPMENIEQLAEWIKIFDISGVNVTIPYKQTVMSKLDYISEEAQEIGAVNTISNINGKLHGYNTDYYGFGDLLQVNNISVENKTTTVLGTGGSSKAVIAYLKNQNVKKIYWVSRTKSSDHIDYEDLNEIKSDILINTTPVGMSPNIDDSPVSADIIQNHDILVDLIYNPKATSFLQIGQEQNKKTVGGMHMLIAQAVKAEEIWHNTKISSDFYKDIKKEVIL